MSGIIISDLIEEQDLLLLLLKRYNSADLEEANIIQPGSGVRYSYLFLAAEENIQKLENFFQSIKTGDGATPDNEAVLLEEQ